MSVVLPAPFGPSSPKISPRSTCSDTLSRASVPPNRLVTPSARIGTVEAVIARKDTVKPLRDRVRLPMRALFVGINPGIRSAITGHHFAGFSNRFWNLLFESGLVPERVAAEDDDRLPEWGYGVTNLIARPTPGIDTLRADEYIVGARVLRRKVRRWNPPVMALVGVTLYRSLFPAAARTPPARRTARRAVRRRARIRPSESERAERELLVRRDARGVYRAAAAPDSVILEFGIRAGQQHSNSLITGSS